MSAGETKGKGGGTKRKGGETKRKSGKQTSNKSKQVKCKTGKQGSEPIEWQALMQFRNKETIEVAVVYEEKCKLYMKYENETRQYEIPNSNASFSTHSRVFSLTGNEKQVKLEIPLKPWHKKSCYLYKNNGHVYLFLPSQIRTYCELAEVGSNGILQGSEFEDKLGANTSNLIYAEQYNTPNFSTQPANWFFKEDGTFRYIPGSVRALLD